MNHIARSSAFDFTHLGESLPPLGGGLKRCFDIWVAAVALITIAPLFLLIAVLVKMSDGGTVFYGHERVGLGGRMFRCLKFRTMRPDGDDILAEYLKSNLLARQEWEETRKLKQDPRVTVVGHVLRKLSIDELPQILNILMGEMSLVGPRPVVLDELDRYGIFADHYLRSRPGLTGLWQVSGRNDLSYDARVNFDRKYVEQWSLLQDLHIIFKTVPAVCLSRGTY